MDITLFTKDSMLTLNLNEAYELIKERGFFHVFLSFVDPRTDCLVQDYFCFYPKPQPSYAGGGVIADFKGLTLRIPYDLKWYAEKQRLAGSHKVKRDVTVLKRGEYVKANVVIDVTVNIRLFDTENRHVAV